VTTAKKKGLSKEVKTGELYVHPTITFAAIAVGIASYAYCLCHLFSYFQTEKTKVSVQFVKVNSDGSKILTLFNFNVWRTTMSYVDDQLMTGEQILYRARMHWILFLWPAIFFVFAITSLGSGSGPVLIFGGLGLLTGILSFLNYTTSEFALTDKRIIAKVGFIRRNSLELLLSKVEAVLIDQSVLGRLTGYGTIVISGTGGTRSPFSKIAAPLEFRKKTQEQLSIVQDNH